MMPDGTASIRGACPGAMSPMESGDGLIVRVRPRAGALAVSAVKAIAAAAAHFGNGHIDLTRRANLQIRGVRPATLAGLQASLDTLGLLDANPRAEAVRNILVSPLAGCDPSEVVDVRPMARKLEGLLATHEALWRLPPKFAFAVDGGGALGLAGERADIRLNAVARHGRAAVAIGIDRPGGAAWLGCTGPDEAPGAAVRAAVAFLGTQPAASRVRIGDAGPGIEAHIRTALALIVQPLEASRTEALARPSSSSRHDRRDDASETAPDASHNERAPIGELMHDGEVFALGIAAPLGRVEAHMLVGLADGAAAAGAAELRLSPWRNLYVALSGEEQAARLLAAARSLGFITDHHDPMLRIEACPGAPACRSATLDTRAAARALARLLLRLGGVHSLHVSGCAKGCARSAPADLVLVGQSGRYGMLRNGRADGAVEASIEPADLDRVPEIAAALARGSGHA